jgi:general secretion pathway protein H
MVALAAKASTPTWETGNWNKVSLSALARPCRGSGFTLIELLVVVVIIGIISAILVLGLGTLGDDRDLRNDARRMTSLIEMASDEAMLQGRDFGLEIMQSAYRFVEYEPLTGVWFEVIGDDLMRPRQLGENTEFDLFLEEKRVLLEVDAIELAQEDDDENDRDPDDDYQPHVLVLSSGDISPFVLEIIRLSDRASVRVSASAAGELKVGRDEDL